MCYLGTGRLDSVAWTHDPRVNLEPSRPRSRFAGSLADRKRERERERERDVKILQLSGSSVPLFNLIDCCNFNTRYLRQPFWESDKAQH